MAKQPNDNQAPPQTYGFRNRLPEELVNPNGVYSGIARRNAMEDGAFFPPASTAKVDKSRRGGGADAGKRGE